MKGESCFKDLLELMSTNFDSNYLSYGSGTESDERSVTRDGMNYNQLDLPPALPPWFPCPRTPHNYTEFDTANLSSLGKAPCTTDFLGCSMPPPVSASLSVNGVPGMLGELPKHNPGIVSGSTTTTPSSDLPGLLGELPKNNPGIASGSTTTSPLSDLDIWKLYPTSQTLNSYEALLNLKVPKPYSEVESMSKYRTSDYMGNAQNQILSEQESSRHTGNILQIHPTAKVAPSVFLSKPNDKVSSRRRAAKTDRQRRARISERLMALQQLLPNSKEESQAAIYDDIIDHIKYLQLQVKELSRSKLGGESTAAPFIFLEGYGHYMVHELMMNEPLEEMIGLLLEVNSSAANQLLESKGLYVMPIDLAERLQQAM